MGLYPVGFYPGGFYPGGFSPRAEKMSYTSTKFED